MSNGLALGIDLGGTKLYAIITDEKHNIVSEAKTATDVNAEPETIVEQIIAVGKEALSYINADIDNVENIGVAVPSPVDPVTGDAYHTTNLNINNISMKELFHRQLEREVWFGNDGNLGVVGEYHCGAAKGYKNVIGYYVGTGLGGGVIINGKLHQGNFGLAGEFGHAIIRYGGRRCGCGHRGCAEAYCSKIAFVKALRKKVYERGVKTFLPPDKFNRNSRNIKSKHLAKAYAAGDPAVCEVINKGAFMLGVAAASACALVAPECIILGGGVIEAMGKEMFPSFKAGFDEYLFGLSPSKIAVNFSVLGDAAVALGATVLARKKGDV